MATAAAGGGAATVGSNAVSCGGDGNAAPHVVASTLRAAAIYALPPSPPVPARAARATSAPARAPAWIQRREQDRVGRRFASLDGRKLSQSLFRFHRRGPAFFFFLLLSLH